jgi:hypothetical protein
MVVLQFRAEHQVGWTSELIKTYEKAMVDRFEREYMSDNLKLYVLTTWHVEDEMVIFNKMTFYPISSLNALTGTRRHFFAALPDCVSDNSLSI